MVQPGMVYISHPSENGTTYSKSELEELSKVCRECGLPLFMDGARLGYGLASKDNNLSLADIARLCDVFYIGGTKGYSLRYDSKTNQQFPILPNDVLSELSKNYSFSYWEKSMIRKVL